MVCNEIFKKGKVDSGLPKYNRIRLKVYYTNANVLWLPIVVKGKTSVPKVYIIGDAECTITETGVNEITIGLDQSNKNYIIDIGDASDIYYLGGHDNANNYRSNVYLDYVPECALETIERNINIPDLSVLKNCPNLETLSHVHDSADNYTCFKPFGCYDDLFKSESILSINMQDAGEGVTGDIDLMYNKENLNGLVLSNNYNVKGDIHSIGHSLGLVQLSLAGTNCEGTLESLVQRMWGYGKRSGSFNVVISNSNITFHSASLSGWHNVAFTNDGVTIKNSSSSTVIATYNGSTWSYN